MNNNFWYQLNIDISNALRPDWVWDVSVLGHSNMNIQSVRASSICNPEWLAYMKSLGLPIRHVMLFYRNTQDSSGNTAHIDLINTDDTSCVEWAINWVIGGQDSKMVWYELPTTHFEIKRTMANTPYVSWNISELKEIEHHEIKNVPTVVKTAIPHSVKIGADPRWCISVRSSLDYTWEELIVHLKSQNLLIERN